MAIHKFVDRHCNTCHGTGMISEGREIDGDWWQSFMECHCVTYSVSPETRRLIDLALLHSTEKVSTR